MTHASPPLAAAQGRIQVLRPEVINKIAAGEVIERPASVIKELMENSLDALATRIDIDIEEGGAELIRIVDDGEGMVPDDLPLAVTSHATSKLTKADDLFCVQTMGFRGEALASIAEVSDFRLKSRVAGAAVGAQLQVLCGQRSPVTPCGMPQGTQIEIRQLFCNTPVRRKFLKKGTTEFGYISEQFLRVALACPRLQMSLTHNGKQVYRMPGQQQLLARLERFFGSEVTDKLIPVETSHHGIRLWGYVGHPSQHKSTRKSQYLYLNGRFIQDRTLQHALNEAYRGLIMGGRFPISFLFLEMPGDQVDVNVHPTKSEVRFRDSQLLFRMLLSTLRTKFLQSDLHSELQLKATPAHTDAGSRQRQVELDLVSWAKTQLERQVQQLAPPVSDGPLSEDPHFAHDRPAEPPADGHDWLPRNMRAPNQEFQPQESITEDGLTSAGQLGMPQYSGQADFPDNDENSTSAGTDLGAQAAEYDSGQWAAATDAAAADRAGGFSPALSSLRPLSANSPEVPAGTCGPTGATTGSRIPALQVDDCYLVLSTDQGLTVIDQHALHERVLYERFRRKVLEQRVEVQKLLVPLVLEMTDEQIAALLERQDLIAEMGFGLEEFGRGALAVTSQPVFLGRWEMEQVIREFAEKLLESESLTRRDLLDSALHMMACKAAVKAGDKLTTEEIISLLAQRDLVDDAHHCPHGRPTALVLSREELDRQFGRLGA